MRTAQRLAVAAVLLALGVEPAMAAMPADPPTLFSIPIEFILFAATLLTIALFHRYTFPIALAGLSAIIAYKLAVTGFKTGPGLAGLAAHLGHEWVILANLFLLLTGFAILAHHFEESRAPELLPAILPDDWKGGLALLGLVFVLSSFLDNIAAALIGGTVARTVYLGRVHIGFLAALVAASNAGGAGSVLGDTTTTMMWIDGVSPLAVAEAYVAAVVAFVIFAVPAALQQHRLQSIQKDAVPGARLDWTSLSVVIAILLSAVTANTTANIWYPEILDRLPVIGLAVWGAILVCSVIRGPDWALMPGAIKGTIFLLALVTAASVMPVESLPTPSWHSTLGLGFVSAVFDNIPLTALALKQGGYDWGYVAYAVGFGGSMIWFGSSAGVALSNMYPEAKSATNWLRQGWHVIIAYVVGFFVMLLAIGWHPDAAHRERPGTPVDPAASGAATSEAAH